MQDETVVIGPGTDPGRDGLDEAQLVRLRESYERTHARLWRALLAWSGDRHVADEAAAEAFAQAARRGDALRDVDAWVWRAAFRIAAGELKKQRHRPVPVDITANPSLTDNQAVPAVSADAVDLIRALGQLTEQRRACVVLRDIADLPVAEIAVLLGTTSATVRVQLHRARRALRHLLEDHDD